MASASDSIEVEAPAQRCDEYWRDLTQLPTIFEDAEEVTQTDSDTHQWRVTEPSGKTIVWEARITEDVPRRQARRDGGEASSRNPEEQVQRALEWFKRVVEAWSKAA
jgi:hypothetical protein